MGTTEEPYWKVASTGWSDAGWSEDDPSPEEAVAALASMVPVPWLLPGDGDGRNSPAGGSSGA